MLNALKNRGNYRAGDTELSKQVQALQSTVGQTRMVNSQATAAYFATESLDQTALESLNSTGENLETALTNMVQNLGIAYSFEGYSSLKDDVASTKPTVAQIEAAAMAGLLAGDYKKTIAFGIPAAPVATESMAVINPSLSDSVEQRSYSMEAFSEEENRNAVVFGMAYNFNAARQDEFGETLWPTLTISADNAGIGITVNLLRVYDGIERKVTGKFEDWKFKNLVRAQADPTILKKNQTRMFPIKTAQNQALFSTAVPATAVLEEGESLNVAPLLFNKKVDLVAVSTSAALLASGVQDETDSIDPGITLDKIYMTLDDNVLELNVGGLPLANFTASVQNNYRVQTLNFQTTSILLNKLSTQADGSPLDGDLAAIVSSDLIVRVEVQVSGTVNLQTGECTLFASEVSVHSVKDSSGQDLDPTTGPQAPVVAALAAGKLDSYKLLAYRTNANRRQTGQKIDTTKYVQMYTVPHRSPITAQHPVNTDGSVDAADIQALLVTTRYRTNNEAVTALLDAATQLASYVDARDLSGEGPDVLGVGRFYVRAYMESAQLDVAAEIDSLKSHERAEDIQAVLVNKIRDMAYRMYTNSEYKAGQDALSGGVAPVPVVQIATDPILARYINVTGDLRTLSGSFDVRIVHTLDVRMRGKIIITFGVYDENRNVAPHPMNFGNMLWAPELVLTVNTSRNGRIVKESVVQPRYLFVTHCPVMGLIEVTNVPDSLNKVPLNIKVIEPIPTATP
jgi:hypothetical protein